MTYPAVRPRKSGDLIGRAFIQISRYEKEIRNPLINHVEWPIRFHPHVREIYVTIPEELGWVFFYERSRRAGAICRRRRRSTPDMELKSRP